MRTFAFIAAVAAFASLGQASSSANATHSKVTHFIDPKTNHTVQHFGCDVHRGTASHHFIKTITGLHKAHKHSKAGTRAARSVLERRQQVQTPIQVPTYFHVISTAAAANAQTITQAMANAQIAAMNTAYNPYGISFTLVNTDFTTNDAWAIAQPADMDAAKQALRQGNYADLNIYFHTDFAGGNLGTCTLPTSVDPAAPPATYYTDGCNVNANTMPGGTMMGYNAGMTAVHETGHWLGLLHTFEGYSCSGDGDSVDDTPQESVSTNGCPDKPAKDSCPTVTGVDPIHNYMDYSTDACYEEFTPDQITRIGNLWTQYRAPAAVAASKM